VKCNPLLPHVGHPLVPQPLLVQGTLDDAVARHAPVSLAAARGERDLVPRYPQGQQVASARARPRPLFPVAQPYPSPQPPIPFDHFGIALTVAEVVEPSADLPFPGLDATFHVAPVAPFGHLTDALLEPSDGRVRPMHLATSHLEAKEGARAQARGLGLGRVDAQSQAPFDASADTAQHPRCRSRTAYEDQEVIGIARKAPSATFPFFVQVVEHHLG
jgi:hypothetical protein